MGNHCRSVLDAKLPTATMAKEIRSCGYAHIGPGLFPADYVKALKQYVKQWDGNTTDAFHSGAAGGRINVVPPPNGPFGGDQPFSQPKRTFYELMQRVLSPGRCCHLFLLSVMLALPESNPHVELPASGDQLWHRDQLRRFRKSAPWTKGEWNHYYGAPCQANPSPHPALAPRPRPRPSLSPVPCPEPQCIFTSTM